jgi:hypothetical protein
VNHALHLFCSPNVFGVIILNTYNVPGGATDTDGTHKRVRRNCKSEYLNGEEICHVVCAG